MYSVLGTRLSYYRLIIKGFTRSQISINAYKELLPQILMLDWA